METKPIKKEEFVKVAEYFKNSDARKLYAVEDFLNDHEFAKYVSGELAGIIRSGNNTRQYSMIDIVGVGDSFSVYSAIKEMENSEKTPFDYNGVSFKVKRDRQRERQQYNSLATVFNIDVETPENSKSAPINLAILTNESYAKYESALRK